MNFGIVSIWFIGLVVRFGCFCRIEVIFWIDIVDICGGVGVVVKINWIFFIIGLVFFILIGISRIFCLKLIILLEDN